jgi:phosphoribosylanthranilate isomerase
MRPILVQIYEVQEPQEAGPLIELGVDHIGGVLLSREHWQVPLLRESIRLINRSPSKSALIPLLTDTGEILRALAYYEPALVHFCDWIPLDDEAGASRTCERFASLQEQVRREFPAMGIIRSLPVPEAGAGSGRVERELLRIASLLEGSCDFFMTDTLLGPVHGESSGQQPVAGFVGITGRGCDWGVASALCRQAKNPVILAGGVSPDNVREAVLDVRPAGVDSCTHTNLLNHQGLPIRFRKDLAKVRRLLEEVRHAEETMWESTREAGQ